MAFSAPFTAVTGAVFTAAQWNTSARDNLNALWPYTASNQVAYSTSATALAVALVSDLQAPAGAVIDYGGASAPTGWLLCNGAAVSRTTYSTLFSILSTTFGSGDGSTTFNVPDARGRATIGAGTGTGLTARTLGANVGAETHVLSVTELPTHTHTEYYTGAVLHSDALGTGGGDLYLCQIHQQVNSGPVGNNVAHANMQPSIVFNKIIKT